MDGRTHGRTHGRTDARTNNVKTVYPLQTKFAWGINIYRLITNVDQNFYLRAAYIYCIYSSALQTRFYHRIKHYEPCSNCSLVNSLILVHNVCNRLISVVDVVITPMNPYQPIPFYILSFAVFQSRILIYAGSNI